MRHWLRTKRVEAMAALNADETFWLHLHQMNTSRIQNQKPKKRMPDLGYLAKHEPGTFPLLEELLEHRVLEYAALLLSPTSHHQHWQTKVNTIRFLYNNIDDLKDLLIHVHEDAYEGDSNDAFELAWDTYVERYCMTKEDIASQIYPPGYPACDAENTCYICELQWDNSQNAVRKRTKCTCCETTQEEYLLPDFSMFDPVTPNGSQDEHKNQHIWSISIDNNNLEKCLTPETTTT